MTATAMDRRIIRRVTLGDNLTRAARVHGQALALVDGHERVSYAALEAQANQFAHHLVASLPPGQLEKQVRRSVSRAADFGIRQRSNAFRIAAWDLHSDDVFETVDPAGRLRQILHADLLEEDKMRLLTERLAQLGQANG